VGEGGIALSVRALTVNTDALVAVAGTLIERGVLKGEEMEALLGTVRGTCGC